MKYLAHLAERIFDKPLMVEESKLHVIMGVLGSRLGLDVEVPEVEAAPRRRDAVAPPAGTMTAVIPIYGTLVNRTSRLDAMSGLVSYSDIGDRVIEASADPAVGRIVLHIDSGGGEVAGAFTLADIIAEVAATKPVIAVVDDMAFSAAYLLASAASEIVVSKTAGVGSVGVIAVHRDQSAYNEKQGLRYTAVYAGARKNDLSPHAPLTEEASATLKSEIDRCYALFVDAVASRRGMSAAAVKSTEAGLFWGEAALTSKLADRFGTLRQVLSEPLAAASTDPRAASAVSEKTESEDIPMSEKLNPAADAQPSAAPANVDAKLIAELCTIAGKPEMCVAFIRDGKSVDDVRAALLQSRAEAVAPLSAAHAGIGNALGSIEAAAETLRAQNPSMTRPQAIRKALVQNPGLYEAYAQANPKQFTA